MNLNDLPVGAATNVITRIRLENEEVVNQPNVRHGRSEREVRMRRTNLSFAEQLTRDSARGQMQSMKCTDDAKESFRHKPYCYDTSVTSQNRSELIKLPSMR